MQGLKRHVLLGGTATGTGGGITDPNLRLNFIYEGYSVAETRYTFPQLIDFTRTSAATFVNSSGNIASTPQSRNLLTFTQEFDNNGAWAKARGTITANSTVAPDGTSTADTLTATATGIYAAAYRLNTVYLGGVPYTFSVYAKANAGQYLILYVNETGSVGNAIFDLNSGAVSSVSSGTTASAVSVGNGWWRCSVTGTPTATSVGLPIIGVVDSGTVTTVTSGKSIFIWGAQLEQASSATDYTRNFGGLFPPRFDYDPVTRAPRGLLIEEQRTNLLVRSEEFDNASWGKTNATVTANATTSPDGTVDADRLVDDATSGLHFTGQTVTLAATTYAISFYAKADTLSRVLIRENSITGNNASFDLSNGTVLQSSGVTATITNAGNGWYRCTIIQTIGTPGATQYGIFTLPAGGSTFANATYAGTGQSLFIYGAQLEAGAFATSYIPTVASQVTRTADGAVIQAPMFASWYNQASGTIVADYATFIPVSQIVTSTPVSFAINDGTANNSIHSFSAGAAPGLTRGTVAVGGATQAAMDVTPALLSGKVALAYTTNDFAFSAGGSAAVVDTSGSVPTVNSLQLGRLGGAATLNGWVRSLRYYPVRLTNAQLQALSA